MNFLKNNCCDGIYNSLDIHFTSACDNKCSHCIDMRFSGVGAEKPNVKKIFKAICKNMDGVDDVLFLGGEPCLYLDELLQCVELLRDFTDLKIFVTTSVPKVCADKSEKFYKLIDILDGINLSVQHYDEEVADTIRNTKSNYDRQVFYKNLPHKDKIRINLNVVKPYLHIKKDIVSCIEHYDKMGFNSIKISEIQHGKEWYVSFADVFNIEMKSAYSHGCQTYLNTSSIIPGIKTPVLLKRSCFMCEETLNASLLDGLKAVTKTLLPKRNKYGVIYANGKMENGWV